MFWIIIYFMLTSYQHGRLIAVMVLGIFVLATYTKSLNGTLKLDEMFKSLTDDIFEEYPSNVIVKKLSVDLEQLGLKNITDKLNSMRRESNTTDVQETVLKEFKTRRLGPQGNSYERDNATNVLIKTKIYDLMLQTIYMARHKIKQVENEPYFNSKDTSYRIAFLYRRIRRIWKRMYDIYTTMELNKHETEKFRLKFTRVDTYLTLHYKAAKLHIDFLYLWWVLVKLHEKFHYRHEVPNTFPPNKD